MSSARKRAAIYKANKESEFLKRRLMLAEHQVDKVTALAKIVTAKYDELVFAVSRKFEGETRHETALRYIQSAEAAALSSGTADSTMKEVAA